MALKTDVQLKNEFISGATITKGLCDDLIDSKVNRNDIVDDLITGGTTVPLSAEQGKILDQKTASDIPTIGTGESIQDVLNDFLDYRDAVCVAHLSTNQTIQASDGYQKLLFDVADVDPKGWFDTVNNKYTPQIAGWYDVKVQIYLNTTAADTGVMSAYITKNGSTNVASSRTYMSNSSSTIEGIPAIASVYCNGSTDFITTGAAQTNHDGESNNVDKDQTHMIIKLLRKA